MSRLVESNLILPAGQSEIGNRRFGPPLRAGGVQVYLAHKKQRPPGILQ